MYYSFFQWETGWVCYLFKSLRYKDSKSKLGYSKIKLSPLWVFFIKQSQKYVYWLSTGVGVWRKKSLKPLMSLGFPVKNINCAQVVLKQVGNVRRKSLLWHTYRTVLVYLSFCILYSHISPKISQLSPLVLLKVYCTSNPAEKTQNNITYHIWFIARIVSNIQLKLFSVLHTHFFLLLRLFSLIVSIQPVVGSLTAAYSSILWPDSITNRSL